MSETKEAVPSNLGEDKSSGGTPAQAIDPSKETNAVDAKYPKDITGHYEELEDGKILIKEEHIFQDLDTIIKGDLKTYLKVFDVNQEKAEVLAKSLGAKSDGIKSGGKLLYEAIDAYVNETDDAKKELIKQTYFPKGIDDRFKANFVWGDQSNVVEPVVVPEKEKASKKVIDTDESVYDLVGDHVQRNLYKFVDKSMTDEQVDGFKKDMIKSVTNSSDFYSFVNKEKWNPETGEKLTRSQKIESFFSSQSLNSFAEKSAYTPGSSSPFKSPDVINAKEEEGRALARANFSKMGITL